LKGHINLEVTEWPAKITPNDLSKTTTAYGRDFASALTILTKLGFKFGNLDLDASGFPNVNGAKTVSINADEIVAVGA